MKRNELFAIVALLAIVVIASTFLLYGDHWALPAPKKVYAQLKDTYTDVRLRYLTAPQKFSGTIDSLSPAGGSFLLWTTPTCGLPIAIDSAHQKPFRDGSIKSGDWVTVSVRTRMSPSRKYGQYYLQKIRVDVPGIAPLPAKKRLSDFSEEIKLSITSHKRDSGLTPAPKIGTTSDEEP